MASDPLGIERKEQKKDGTAHSATYQRLLYLCKFKNYLIEWQILTKSNGIRAELWLIKPLSASPVKQMHRKHYSSCALYPQGPLGPRLAQPDWAKRGSHAISVLDVTPRTNQSSDNAGTAQLKLIAAVSLISLASPTLQSGYNCIFKVFTKPVPQSNEILSINTYTYI